jgi:hypothetical protein
MYERQSGTSSSASVTRWLRSASARASSPEPGFGFANSPREFVSVAYSDQTCHAQRERESV